MEYQFGGAVTTNMDRLALDHKVPTQSANDSMSMFMRTVLHRHVYPLANLDI